MRSHVRVSILAFVVSALVVALAPAAAQAFEFESWFAGNCSSGHEACNKVASPSKEPKQARKEEVEKAEAEGFTQAAGHPNFGVTEFKVKTFEPAAAKEVVVEGAKLAKSNFLAQQAPEANIKALRVDVAPGVVTNPAAVPMCSPQDFSPKVEVGGHVIPGVFFAPTCPASSVIGKNEVLSAIEIPEGKAGEGNLFDAPDEGTVYNLEQASGLGSEFGVALPTGKELGGKELFIHTLIEGSVEWASDYHDYFVIKNVPPGLISSRLTFFGKTGAGTSRFLTNASTCSGPGPQTTTAIHAEAIEGGTGAASFETPIGGSGCEKIPFAPTFEIHPESALSDQPDGLTTETKMPHENEEIDSSSLRAITVTLPAGLTMNPSAAAGLRGCTPKQAGTLESATTAVKVRELKPIGCPAASRLGTVTMELPTLPEGALQGPIYLGQNENKTHEAEPIKGPPYTIYLDAESARYGQRVLLKGTVKPNEETGQLTATFSENPQGPFNDVILHFNGGEYAPLANPLVCGTGKTTFAFTAFSGAEPAPGASPFTTEGCASPSPAFAPTQSTSVVPSTAGAESNFVFKLERPEGQQYLKQISTVLAPGVVGKIPSVPLCSEAQAVADSCPAASQIGTVRALAGSGEPFAFNGTVYLTGPYKGAPYSLLFEVPVVAGPFNLGTEFVHAKIEVNPITARVSVTTTELPVIRGGVPTRLRSMTVDINRPNYILNPTNCGVLTTESTVGSTEGASALVKSPFQVEGCGGLAFKPTFTASTSAKTSKTNGASLVTTMTQAPGQANIKSVFVQLPKALPSRLTTLQKACLAKTFEENPLSCAKASPGSEVGTASAVTPVLPGVMKGPAFLVSHAGEEFPSLELVLEGDNVRVIVEGKTHITKGITTTNFVSTPDVPVSSITVNLPLGSHSALATEKLTTNLCTAKLVMPTTITGQNGVVFKQNTIIAPTECGVQIVGHKVVGNTLFLTIQTYSAGKITASGAGLSTTRKTLGSASKATKLKIPLSRKGRARHRPFKVKVRVGFAPKQKGAKSSSATVTVKF